jgi:hypothetical protein
VTAGTVIAAGGRPELTGVLWELATFDTDTAVIRLAPSDGPQAQGRIISSILLTTGTAQATTGTSRTITRADIGRAQVALARTGMDVVVIGGLRTVPGRDLEALSGAVHAAGRTLYLIDGSSETVTPRTSIYRDIHRKAEAASLTEAITLLEDRPGRDGRRVAWPCQQALPTGAGTGPAPGCSRHVDAVECVLAWVGHAYRAPVDRPGRRSRHHQARMPGSNRRRADIRRTRGPAGSRPRRRRLTRDPAPPASPDRGTPPADAGRTSGHTPRRHLARRRPAPGSLIPAPPAQLLRRRRRRSCAGRWVSVAGAGRHTGRGSRTGREAR